MGKVWAGEILCPYCNGKLFIDITKKRTNEPEPAEYEYTVKTSEIRQEELFPGSRKTLSGEDVSVKESKPRQKSLPKPVTEKEKDSSESKKRKTTQYPF